MWIPSWALVTPYGTFNLIQYETEQEFERAIVAHLNDIFGERRIYLDCKRRIPGCNFDNWMSMDRKRLSVVSFRGCGVPELSSFSKLLRPKARRPVT